MIDKFQLITIITCLIPIINAVTIKIFQSHYKFSRLLNKIFPAISLTLAVILLVNNMSSEIVVFTPINRLEMSFFLNENSLIFLVILNIFWLLFVIYLQKFVSLSSTNHGIFFLENFLLIIISLTLLAASNNLFSILIFYQFITILFYQYSSKFLHKKGNQSSSYFSAIIYTESVILMIAVIFAYQNFSSLDIEFIGKNIGTLNSEGLQKFFILLIAPTLLFSAFPFYLFYRKINLNPLIIFVLFFFLYFLSHSFLFVKFYFEIFKDINISKFALTIFEVVFLVNIFAASIFLVFSKNLKSSFFYLFFQQLLIAIYSTILLLFFKYESPILPLISFALSFFVMVFCLSNILLYFENSKKKKQSKIFGNLKVSVILLLIAILNITAIMPSIGMKVSFLVISKIIEEKLILSAIIYSINIFAVIIFFIKIIFPLLPKDYEHEQFIQDEELSRKIDRNFFLIVPSIIFASGIFLIPIILFFVK